MIDYSDTEVSQQNNSIMLVPYCDGGQWNTGTGIQIILTQYRKTANSQQADTVHVTLGTMQSHRGY